MNTECIETGWPSNRDFLRKFNKKTTNLRVPISGSLDLTHKCNLRCIHCYLGDRNKKAQQELTTSRMLSIIDEITEAGCLYLLITGGEPLLRADFSEIYRHSKKNGLIVTVFTNGTIITDSILELFVDFPPHVIEISLYGATASTYEKITGVEGSFGKCLSGIRRLLEHKIHLRLKTILMTLNSHEFFDMERMAKEFGVKFRFDAAIFPRMDGDKYPLNLRVSPEDAVEKELYDNKRRFHWGKYFEETKGQHFSDSLYCCGAGLTGFYIDPSGGLQPCLMTTGIRYDISKGSFADGWRDVLSHIRDKKAAKISECNRCEKKNVCGYCPAFFEMETGSEEVRSEYLCAIGSHRLHIIKNGNSQGVENAETRQRED